MIRVDLNSCKSFIPLPYEAALAPRLRIAHDHLQKGRSEEHTSELQSR